MTNNVSAGDKLTCIRVNSIAGVSISEITVDEMRDSSIIFTQKRKQYAIKPNHETIILRGHNLGVEAGHWKTDCGWGCIMDANINLSGLTREGMIELLKTNINPDFNEWLRVHWFDGTSEVGEAIFEPKPVSQNYLRYREEATGNNDKQASEIQVGDFINTYMKGSKHQHLTDMLDFHLNPDTSSTEQSCLGKIVDIVDVTDEQFSSLVYHDDCDLIMDKGGDFSDDIAEGRDKFSLSSAEMETLYSHLTLIRTPSGRAITVDPQGYDYMRYTGLLMHYRESMADDCAKVKPKTTIATDGIELILNYSEKAFAIIGNTKEIKDTLKSLGGRYNPRLSCGAGWIFSKKKLDEVKEFLKIA